MVEAGLSNRSMSKTETLGEEVSFKVKALRRTICQVVPAAGCQMEPEVLVGGMGVGVLEGEGDGASPLLPPWVRPTPRPIPSPIAMRIIMPHMVMWRRLKPDRHPRDFGFNSDMSTLDSWLSGS